VLGPATCNRSSCDFWASGERPCPNTPSAFLRAVPQFVVNCTMT